LTVIRVDHVEARFVLGGEAPTRLSHTQEALPGGSAESRLVARERRTLCEVKRNRSAESDPFPLRRHRSPGSGARTVRSMGNHS
jgi:hypothetical protein